MSVGSKGSSNNLCDVPILWVVLGNFILPSSSAVQLTEGIALIFFFV
jgi:hypothetical protein